MRILANNGLHLLTAAVLTTSAVVTAELPQAEPLPLTVVGDIEESEFKEPSGLCYHPTRKTLFVVGDGGDLGELKTDGTMIRQKRIRKADFEGITCNPSTGLLYIAVEGDEVILEVNPDNLAVLREFQIERSFEGELKMQKGGDGIEAITFVPNTKHPHGGTFYVANQGKDLTHTNDVSAIFELEVPLNNSATNGTATIKRSFSIGAIDMAGLHYNSVSGHLLVVSDKMNRLFSVTLDGKVLSAYPLPGTDQEGVALDGADFLYIAQDSGGILKLKLWTPTYM